MSERTGAGAGVEMHDAGLSGRERDVLALCADGLSNREIAERLYVSIETVKTHLRNVYARLGLRNRAQAAAYFLGAATTGAAPAPDTDVVSVAQQLGIDGAAIDERRALLGLTEASRGRLAPLADAVAAGAAAFTERLYARLRSHPETAAHLADDATVRRLEVAQQQYLQELFGGPFDDQHVERMLRVGATHHRVGLAPQWYLATYAHVVGEHLDLVFDASVDDTDAVETTIVLLASAFFDASLALDSYELSVADELVSTREPPGGGADVSPDGRPAPGGSPPGTEGRAHRRPLTRVNLTRDEAAQRRAFIGLDTAALGELHRIADVVDGAVPRVLDEFYGLVAGTPSVAELVPADAVPRLMAQVSSYWSELVRADFDRAYAAARMRVGMVHERLGVPSQLYLAGLARQIAGVLRALPGRVPDVRRAAGALLRSVLFDTTFVVDAYLEARADTLLHAGGYAAQLVSGLVSGVAVVDARDRVDHANRALLDLVGVDAGVLRRMPIANALPFPGIDELLRTARRSPSGRAVATDVWRGRHVRLTAVTLRLDTPAAASPVALVVDDISDVVRAGAIASDDDRVLERVLDAVDAVAWEIDAEDLTVLTVSRSVSRLTGRRDLEVVGRPFTALLTPVDRPAFSAACRATAHGPHGLRHRFEGADGRPVFVRSVLVRSSAPDGTARVCGVSRVDALDVHDA